MKKSFWNIITFLFLYSSYSFAGISAFSCNIFLISQFCNIVQRLKTIEFSSQKKETSGVCKRYTSTLLKTNPERSVFTTCKTYFNIQFNEIIFDYVLKNIRAKHLLFEHLLQAELKTVKQQMQRITRSNAKINWNFTPVVKEFFDTYRKTYLEWMYIQGAFGEDIHADMFVYLKDVCPSSMKGDRASYEYDAIQKFKKQYLQAHDYEPCDYFLTDEEWNKQQLEIKEKQLQEKVLQQQQQEEKRKQQSVFDKKKYKERQTLEQKYKDCLEQEYDSFLQDLLELQEDHISEQNKLREIEVKNAPKNYQNHVISYSFEPYDMMCKKKREIRAQLFYAMKKLEEREAKQNEDLCKAYSIDLYNIGNIMKEEEFKVFEETYQKESNNLIAQEAIDCLTLLCDFMKPLCSSCCTKLEQEKNKKIAYPAHRYSKTCLCPDCYAYTCGSQKGLALPKCEFKTELVVQRPDNIDRYQHDPYALHTVQRKVLSNKYLFMGDWLWCSWGSTAT